MSELKRCPFCGEEARLQKKNRKRGWYVICKNTNCGCRTPFYQHQYTSEEDLRTIATMVWNTRKPMQNIVERLEEQAEECRKYWQDFDDEESFCGMNAYCYAVKIVKEEGGLNET